MEYNNCPKCKRKIKPDDETVLAFGSEFHRSCCPHRVIKRRTTHGRKSRKKIDCIDCGKILCGKDMKEIRERVQRENEKRNNKKQSN